MAAPLDAKEHRTVSRVTNIMELAASSDEGIRLPQLSAALNAPRSSIHSLVKGLVANGYLREDSGAYTIGPAVGALLAAPRQSIDRAARPSMVELQREFNETVMLSFLVGDALVYTDAVESTHPIRYSAPLRTRRPLYPTSSGKCFLAYANKSFREWYLDSHLEDGQSKEQVCEELKQVRESGVAINRGQTLPDVSGVAVPLVSEGQLLAVLATAGPTTRIADRLDEIAAVAMAHSSEIVARYMGDLSSTS